MTSSTSIGGFETILRQLKCSKSVSRSLTCKKNQKGVFTIELALVGSVIAVFLAFISDVVAMQTMQGHLQRLSFSGASIIKERTQLYDGSETIDAKQVNKITSILNGSLTRTMSGFDPQNLGVVYEQVQFKVNDKKELEARPLSDGVPFSNGGLQSCKPERPLPSLADALAVKTEADTGITLYQVTLCYKGSNWFGSLVGEDYSTVRVSSIMVGR